MNKIKNLLKASPILMVVAGLVIAGVAGAAVVNFLSDYVSTTANVTSPIEMSVNEGANGSWTSNKSITIDTTGGSDFTFTTVAKNNANNTIEGYPVIVAVAPEGQNFTGGEITKVMFGDENYWPETNMIDITEYLYVVYSDGSLHELSEWTGDSKRLVLFFDNNKDGDAQPYPIEAGEVNWNVLTITPNAAIAPGIYGIYAQYASDLAEYATYQYGL